MAKKLEYAVTFNGVDRVSRKIDRMEGRVSRFLTKLTKESKGLTELNAVLGTGLRRTTIATAALAAGATMGIMSIANAGADFESSMVSASAKFGIFNRHIGEGRKQFIALEKKARSAALVTEFTAKESASAFNYLAMAGFNARQSIAALPGVLNIATISETDLGRATDIVTDSLGAFNLLAKDIQDPIKGAIQLQKNLARVNDVTAATITRSNTNIEQFYEAMQDGAPVATAAGASVETFSTLVGKLADSGIKGTKAGTAIKNMYLRLADPSVGRILRRLRVNVASMEPGKVGEFRDMFDILEDIKKSVSRFGGVKRAGLIDAIFGKRAIAPALVLMSRGKRVLNEFREGLQKAMGTSTLMANAMRDKYNIEWLKLKSVINETGIMMSKYTNRHLRNLMARTRDWVVLNKGFFEGIGKGLGLMLKYPKSIAVIITTVGSLLTALFALKFVLWAIMTYKAAILLGSAGAAILTVTTLAGAVLALTAAFFIFRKDLQDTKAFKGWVILFEKMYWFINAMPEKWKELKAIMTGGTYQDPATRHRKQLERASMLNRVAQYRRNPMGKVDPDPFGFYEDRSPQPTGYTPPPSVKTDPDPFGFNEDRSPQKVEISISADPGLRAEVTKEPSRSSMINLFNTADSGAF